MAPSRGKGKSRASAGHGGVTNRTPRRSTRKTQQDEVPDVYRDLLREAGADATLSASDGSERPLKKRRTITSVSVSNGNVSASKQKSGRKSRIDASGEAGTSPTQDASAGLETVEDSSQAEDDDENEDTDFDFEDVDLAQPSASSPAPAEHEDGIADVSVSVDPVATPSRQVPRRRKPASAAEKVFRLLVHKAYVLCLLGHCIYINTWCNNAVVQRHVRPILSKKTISYLNPKTEDSQFQRNRSFMDGLQQAAEAFRGQFRANVPGMRRARWATDGERDDVLSNETDPVDRSDFIAAAKNLESSQDSGNQLFCALLRSVGVEARLVCSLQPLPFASSPAKSSTPQKVAKPTIFASIASDTDRDTGEEDASVQTSSHIGKVPSVRRRLGQPSFAPEPSLAPPPQKKKPIRKLAYPIFWVEAFNTAHQKWIPIDPIVTQTVNIPSKLEPPSSYDLNQMTYVIAFEDDGVARDVTRRYAKSYNAKTRRQRVESSENGAHWFKQALRIFRRRRRDGAGLDRDAIEDAELAAKEAKEGMPANVQDFKDHPYYALERHLKRHEVLHLRREVGKVNAGTSAKPRMENVYRRQDILVCRNAEKWYRLGRVVREGEQAVKRVPARSPRAKSPIDEGEDESKSAIALYAPFQTELYIPPPVVKCKVPRNAYGNLDIYVPSMVPAGGSYIRHQLAAQAARTLKVDYADAVTGFQFKGRHGTAVTEGAIVAEAYADAVSAVIAGLEDDAVEEQSRGRSAVALRFWRKFLVGLRIQERVSAYGSGSTETVVREEIDGLVDEREGGGFLPGDVQDEEVALPTAGLFSLAELGTSAPRKAKRTQRVWEESDEEEDEYDSEAENVLADTGDDYEPARATKRSRRIVIDEEESGDEYMPDAVEDAGPTTEGEFDGGEAGSGGSLVEEAEGDDGGGGGFLPGDDEVNIAHEFSDGEGGGFMVEKDAPGRGEAEENVEMSDADGVGGGFVLDEVDEAALTSQVAAPLTSTPREEQPETVGEADNSPIHQTTEDVMIDAFGQPEATLANDGAASEEDHPMSTTNNIGKDRDAALDRNCISPNYVAEANIVEEDQSDHGSMISHDPEDDDAEPDWLESD